MAMSHNKATPCGVTEVTGTDAIGNVQTLRFTAREWDAETLVTDFVPGAGTCRAVAVFGLSSGSMYRDTIVPDDKPNSAPSDAFPLVYNVSNDIFVKNVVLESNRYYSPEFGRFISEDPLRDSRNQLRFGAGDVNWYAYVGGNSGNMVDPLGLSYTPIPTDIPILWLEMRKLEEMCKVGLNKVVCTAMCTTKVVAKSMGLDGVVKPILKLIEKEIAKRARKELLKKSGSKLVPVNSQVSTALTIRDSVKCIVTFNVNPGKIVR